MYLLYLLISFLVEYGWCSGQGARFQCRGSWNRIQLRVDSGPPMVHLMGTCLMSRREVKGGLGLVHATLPYFVHRVAK